MVGAGWVLLGERPTTKEGEMMAVWTWGWGKEAMRVSVDACGVAGVVGREGRSRVVPDAGAGVGAVWGVTLGGGLVGGLVGERGEVPDAGGAAGVDVEFGGGGGGGGGEAREDRGDGAVLEDVRGAVFVGWGG